MLEKFKTKELVVCALFGASMFIIAFVLGQALVAITGIPMIGGIMHALIEALLLVIGVSIIRKFGSATLIFLIAGILSTPTASAGPPGLYKIIFVLAIGVLFDIIITLIGRKKIGYIIAAAVSFSASIPIMYTLLVYLNLPVAEKLQSAMFLFMLVYAALAAIGAYLGLWLYDKKLKNKAFVRQMRGE